MSIYYDMVASVNAAVRRVSEDSVPGAYKAFVVDVARELGQRDIEAFKRWLVMAHKAGDVRLARCDLVEAYEAEAVASSEIRSSGAEWHFIRVEDAPSRSREGR